MSRPSRATPRILAPLLGTLFAGCAAHAPKAGANPAEAIRADRWDAARIEAAGEADPVAAKLVAFYRMLAPGQASYAEIAAFQRDNPAWPNQSLLERRREEALARESDPNVLAQGCATALTSAPALSRCADAASDPARAAGLARQAWPGITDAAAEVAFLRRWSGALRPYDYWARFDVLAWAANPAAAAQAPRLVGAYKAVAEARLGLRRDDPKGAALANALEPAIDPALLPGLFLDHARYLRRAGQGAEALELWKTRGAAAEALAREHADAFWAERNRLARKLLRDGDPAGAYELVCAHGGISPGEQADADFLGGYIALRGLSDPARALPWFRTLAASRSAITQGRAHYWLALATQAAGGDPRPEWALSARWPLTYYGQLASAALGEPPDALAARIAAARDPAWTAADLAATNQNELTRAALLLAAWGEARRAALFLGQAGEQMPDPVRRSVLAHLGNGMGLPQTAVAIARRMGRDGLVLPEAGWPAPFDPPSPPEAALSLGVMRQESSFDANALSPSGARGLMQLMPATARLVSAATDAAGSSDEPSVNMRLGTAYLQTLLDQFTLPALAIAAYNAGPHRVREWLAANGDPRTGAIGLVDWIELIPFDETRNYVQRVLENEVIYRARRPRG